MLKSFETERLYIKTPTMDEQHDLWKILKNEDINRYYFPTPDRIFRKYELSKDNINDLKAARVLFLEQLCDWEKQKPFYEKKIESINNEEDSQKYTWSIFLKDGEVIGQITVQQNDEYPDNHNIRDIGWFIKKEHHRKGYATEAAKEVLNYMFSETNLEKIITSAAIINEGSWKIMEKLGFKRTGTKKTTYYNGEEIIDGYCYYIDKDMYNNKNKV